jgi:hypothetical protein
MYKIDKNNKLSAKDRDLIIKKKIYFTTTLLIYMLFFFFIVFIMKSKNYNLESIKVIFVYIDRIFLFSDFL